MAKFQLTSGSSIGQESCSAHPHLLITRLITLPIHQAPKKHDYGLVAKVGAAQPKEPSRHTHCSSPIARQEYRYGTILQNHGLRHTVPPLFNILQYLHFYTIV